MWNLEDYHSFFEGSGGQICQLTFNWQELKNKLNTEAINKSS
jgi:hypothetical protein